MAAVKEESDYDWFAAAGGSDAVEFTKSWPLVDNPVFVLSVMISYNLLIQVGKSYMKDRKPMEVRKLMIVHNFCLVALSTYIFSTFLYHTFIANYQNLNFSKLVCQMPDESLPGHRAVATAMWFYFISKMFDLMDTMYLIVRKRNVSVLHAYHHTTVLFLGWILVRYLPSGASVVGPLLNSFVHMVMYTYYGLAAIGPHMQKYLWWKQYLTKLQMSQFVILFTYTYIPLVFFHGREGCNFPLPWVATQIVYTISLFSLFANFYYQTYVKKAGKKPVSKENGVQNGTSSHNGVANGHNGRHLDAHKVD